MKANYYKRRNIADRVSTGNASAVWRSIGLLTKGTIWRIGDGRTVRCWCDPWIPSVGSRHPITDQGTACVASTSSVDGSWDEEDLRAHMKIKNVSREEIS
jgi:hypothetical protein